MRWLGSLLPLVLIAALAVPAGASAHTMRLTPLKKKVNQITQARVDDSRTPWFERGVEDCVVYHGSRRHRHRGSCVVRFYHVEGHSCAYEVRLRFRNSRSYQLWAPHYRLGPEEEVTCPRRP